MALALLAVLAVAAVAAAFVLSSKLKAVRAELAAEKARPAPPPPPREFESRREAFGLLWFPVLTVDDGKKTVLAAAAGVPHCARCVKAMTLSQGGAAEWSCAGCGEKRPESAADLTVIDGVLGDALREFLLRRPDHRLGPGLKAPRKP